MQVSVEWGPIIESVRQNQEKALYDPGMTPGERLKNLRCLKGKTITQASGETGITCASLYSWERSERLPRVSELVILAEYYGTTLDFIVLGR